MADGRLRQMQLACRLGERTRLRQRYKGAHLSAVERRVHTSACVGKGVVFNLLTASRRSEQLTSQTRVIDLTRSKRVLPGKAPSRGRAIRLGFVPLCDCA